MKNGKALIFCAPSGSGKTTIVKQLLANNHNLSFSISACTRSKREGEVNGKDYHFLSPSDFKTKILEGEFIEWEEVYADNYYGTLKSEIDRIWSLGKHVIFDVDVKGGLKLKEYFKMNALAVFVKVPTLEILKHRLEERGTENEESLARRLAKAEEELSFEKEFDVSLLNNDLEKSLLEAQYILENFIN